ATGPSTPAATRSSAPTVGTKPAATQAAPAPVTAGIGTPAALTAADCDSATKRIKVSFVYAPECVVPWPAGADNGGATSPGVTATTIKVLIYLSSSETTSESDAMTQTQDAAAPYEHLFRMWGRHVEFSTYRAVGNDEVS